MLTLSLLRITFAPGLAHETRILDWGEMAEVPLPPWAQTNQVEAGVLAAEAMVVARGNLSRQIVVQRRRVYQTSPALIQAGLDQDAACSALLYQTGQLSIRLLDLSQPASAGETTRTLRHYQATQAAIKSAVPRAVPEEMALDTTWTIDLGKLTVVAP